MGRGRIEIKKIENTNSRQVTFSKRRAGLMKKARELSILCDAEVGIIIFSNTGKLYDFSSSSLDQIVARYNTYPGRTRNSAGTSSGENVNQAQLIALKNEVAKLQSAQRQMMGKDLGSLSFKELQRLEHQLREGLSAVRDKKEQYLLGQLENSRLQGQKLALENQALSEQVKELQSRLDMNHGKAALGKRSAEKEANADTSLRLGLSVDVGQRTKRAKAESTSHDAQGPVVLE